MKRLLPLAAVALMSVTLAGAAFADVRTPRVNRRQALQHERIVQGMRSGALTMREARRLRRGAAHIRRMERRMKADGRVTRAERMQLQRALDAQSRQIHRLKHGRTV